MSCFLCLETFADAIDYIQIHGPNEFNFNVKNIIVEHFAFLQDRVSSDKDSGICHPCWALLSTFHQFYQRVENAHKFLNCDDKLVETWPIETYLFNEQVTSMEIEANEKEDVLGIKDIKLESEVITERVLRSNRKCVRRRQTELKSVKRKNEKRSVTPEKDSLTKNVKEGTEKNTTTATNQSFCELRSQEKFDSITENQSIFKETVLKTEECKSRKRSDTVHKSKFIYAKLSGQERDDFISNHIELSCYHCNMAIENFVKLKIHYRELHHEEGYVKCCGQTIRRRHKLVDHLRTHDDPTYYKCPRCSKVYSSRISMYTHLKSICGRHPSDKKYNCEFCFKKFHSKRECEHHKKVVHMPEEEKTVPCRECGKTYATEYIMKEHVKKVHLKLYSKICDICGKSVPSSKALDMHLKEHSGVPLPREQCKLCLVSFSTKSYLDDHIKNMHTKENRQNKTCSICSKVLTSIKAYKHHMNYMHKAIPKHTCSMCNQSFKRPLHLKEHMTTHTGETLYKCLYCPNKFSFNARLCWHIKRAHPKEWRERKIARENKHKIKVLSEDDNDLITTNNAFNTLPESVSEKHN